MQIITRLATAAGLAAAAAACGGGTPSAASAADMPASDSADAPAKAAAPTTFAEQVALGQDLYGKNCASCHGASGAGTANAPPVVGLDRGALPLEPPQTAQYRKGQFKTVADIAEFVVANMPAKAPGSLNGEQYWAILAFDLKANGINLEQPLDGELAKTLEVPR